MRRLRGGALSAQTTKDRQESLRARRAMLGQTEVRGIYLPPELHAKLKEIAKILSSKNAAQNETKAEKV